MSSGLSYSVVRGGLHTAHDMNAWREGCCTSEHGVDLSRFEEEGFPSRRGFLSGGILAAIQRLIARSGPSRHDVDGRRDVGSRRHLFWNRVMVDAWSQIPRSE